MLYRILRRFALFFLTLLGMSVFIFIVVYSIPQDPARLIAGDYASRETLIRIRRDLGLDQPIPVQYLRYMRALVRGDLGRSFMTNRPVLQEILTFIPATVELTLVSVAFSLPIGLGLGVISALRRGMAMDHGSRLIAVLGSAMPIFWYGVMLQIVFYRYLGWLPAGGRLSGDIPPPPSLTGMYLADALVARQWAIAIDSFKHLLLPSFSLSLLTIATLARITRSSMLEVLGQDYIRTARAKGLLARRVVWVHAFRNAALPIVTVFGLRFGTILGGAVLTEAVFAWPGIGLYGYRAIVFADFPVVIGFAIVASAMYAVINFLTDAFYLVIDPRLRA